MAKGRWWLGVLYGPALYGPALATGSYDLVCWQAGQPVILERDIAADSIQTVGGSVLRKTDGSTLLLVAPREMAGPCLLRQSKSEDAGGNHPNENGEPFGSPSQHR